MLRISNPLSLTKNFKPFLSTKFNNNNNNNNILFTFNNSNIINHNNNVFLKFYSTINNNTLKYNINYIKRQNNNLPHNKYINNAPISLIFIGKRLLSSSINKYTNTTKIKPISNNNTNNISKIKKGKKKSDLTRLIIMALYDWKLLLIALILLTISCSIGMAIPKVIGLVLDTLKKALSQKDNNINFDMNNLPPIIFDLSIYQFLSYFTVCLLFGTACNYGRYILLRLLSEKVVARLRSKIVKKIIHQDSEFFDKNKVGDLISRLNSDTYLVSRSLTQKVSDGFKSIFCGTLGIGMMITISPQLSSFLIIFTPAVILTASIFGKKIRDISTILQESTGNLTRISEEQLNGIKTVQSFVGEQKEINRYNTAIKDIYNIGKKSAVINSKFSTSTTVIGDMSFLVVLAYGSYLVLNNSLTIGDLTAFMLYTDYTSNSLFGLSNFYSELMQGLGAAKRLFELTDRDTTIKSTIGNKFLPKDGSIEFKNVSFHYPTRPENQIFKNLNFKIIPGTSICIVGPSGRGKSTIALLLLRCYNASSGKILIDDQDISKLNVKSLRRQLGIVQQEPVLMSGTIRDNITYGLTYEPTDDEIREVAKKCFCHNFITKFPKQYDQLIGPHGTLLSGGQKQRIAIARALIKKPKILLLDEATSALDVESEGAINYTFGQIIKSKSITIVSIAHRLSTIRRSEYTIVLGNDGSVVEMGKFKELYADPTSELSKLLNEKQSRLDKKDQITETNNNTVSLDHKEGNQLEQQDEDNEENGDDANDSNDSTDSIIPKEDPVQEALKKAAENTIPLKI